MLLQSCLFSKMYKYWAYVNGTLQMGKLCFIPVPIYYISLT